MENKQKFLIKISYDGTSFAGWQVQKNGPAIQPLIEKALKTILRHEVKIAGSGRTDTGVHALMQTAHFETDINIDCDNLIYRLNALLPKAICIYEILQVPLDFHARYSVKEKTYKYIIYNHPIMDPFLINKAWHIPYCLDLDLIRQACQKLMGHHDFKAFAAKNTQGVASVDSFRDLTSFTMHTEGEKIIFALTAKGFLYKMVRNLVGCVIEIGAKKLALAVIDEAFETKNRSLVGMTAPAHGLYLEKVIYSDLT